MQRKTLGVAVVAGVAAAVLASACSSGPERRLAPLTLAVDVDLARFMGDWHVIAAIPTVFERNAYNPMDSYWLDADGSIVTTFSFNDGGFDGPRKHYPSRGFVVAGSGNAIWGQQYVWPIKADYRIVHVDEAYSETIVGREKRDYVWIMARRPDLPDTDYQRLVRQVAAAGYDVTKLQRVPQVKPPAR